MYWRGLDPVHRDHPNVLLASVLTLAWLVVAMRVFAAGAIDCALLAAASVLGTAVALRRAPRVISPANSPSAPPIDRSSP